MCRRFTWKESPDEETTTGSAIEGGVRGNSHLSAIGALVPVAFLMPLCKERRLKDEKLFRF